MDTIQFQIFIFSITLYGGFIIGIMYDIYRVLRNEKRTSRSLSILDIFFLSLTFFVLISIIFSSNYGELRAYVFIGFIVGFFLYKKIISRIVFALLTHVYNSIIGFTNKIIKYSYRIMNRSKIKKFIRIPKKVLKEWVKYYKLIIKRHKQ